MFCGRRSPEEDEARRTNAVIERKLAEDRTAQQRGVKLLLLGAGESGKSTIFKQMQLIYGSGYSEEERSSLRQLVLANIIAAAKLLLRLALTLPEPLPAQDLPAHFVEAIEQSTEAATITSLPPLLLQATQALWAHPRVREAINASPTIRVPDSTHFMDEVPRITHPDYTPTDQDILRVRLKTTAVVEKQYLINEVTYKIVDVGGQRSERRKWIHCFQNVTAIIFVAALSEYDQVLEEDETVNRVTESTQLFASICNSTWFEKLPIILFLNKTDLFAEKFARSPPIKYFLDFPEKYTGMYPQNAQKYFKRIFIATKKNPDKPVYTHFTCATDTSQVKFVMTAVARTVVKDNLGAAGLI
ncbi:guanine nucleotide-binding protein subunit alpha [Sorochytrium milnesiophthora]